MRGITYNDIAQLNSQLYEREIYYKLEYGNEHQASIWSLGSCACDGKEGLFRDYVEEYFRKKDLTVKWSLDTFTFSVEDSAGTKE